MLGNISNALIFWILYLLFSSYKSLFSVIGSHDTYIILHILDEINLFINVFDSPLLGGSTMTVSKWLDILILSLVLHRKSTLLILLIILF